METRTEEVEVTVDSLQAKAAQVGKNISEIKTNYPKTAWALYDAGILDGNISNGSALFAIGMSMANEEGDDRLSRMELNDFLITHEHGKNAVPQEVNRALDELVRTTSQKDPTALLEQVQKRFRRDTTRLKTDLDGNNPWKIRQVIEHQKTGLDAIDELKAKK